MNDEEPRKTESFRSVTTKCDFSVLICHFLDMTDILYDTHIVRINKSFYARKQTHNNRKKSFLFICKYYS